MRPNILGYTFYVYCYTSQSGSSDLFGDVQVVVRVFSVTSRPVVLSHVSLAISSTSSLWVGSGSHVRAAAARALYHHI